MKQFFTFFYCVIVFFALVGSIGYLFYLNQPIFAIADCALFLCLILGFFKVIELPKHDWL